MTKGRLPVCYEDPWRGGLKAKYEKETVLEKSAKIAVRGSVEVIWIETDENKVENSGVAPEQGPV